MTYVSVYKRRKVIENKGKKCSTEECIRKAISKGFCRECYVRWKRNVCVQ